MNANQPSDEVLMRDYCAGHADAFQQLYSRHEKPLYRYVRRLLGVGLRAQVDDVFQDAWMRLVDALRKSGREISVDEGWLDDDAAEPWRHWPSSSAERPEQQAFWRKAGTQLLHCLEGLPALQRAAFLLQHEEGLSLDEIAHVLNAEFETVKSRLRYAMAKLRACMGAYLEPLSPTGGDEAS